MGVAWAHAQHLKLFSPEFYDCSVALLSTNINKLTRIQKQRNLHKNEKLFLTNFYIAVINPIEKLKATMLLETISFRLMMNEP